MLIKWGERHTDGGQTHLELFRDDELIGQFTETKDLTTARIKPSVAPAADPAEWPEWTFVPHDKGRLSATGPDGLNFHADPRPSRQGKEGRIGRAQKVDVTLADGKIIDIEHCGKQDYVFETPEEVKLGQFSGGDRGVRHVIVEVEEGQENALTTEEQVFVAWLARMQLELRLVSNTWMWTLLLLILLPLMILAFVL